MSDSLFQLPRPYQLAVLLGARVEVYVEDDEKWYPYYQMTGIDRDTPIRMSTPDDKMLESIHRLIDEHFQIVDYKGYDYMFPKTALRTGTITHMVFGLGEYAQNQEDGSLQQIDNDVAKKLIEQSGEPPYVALSKRTFFAEKKTAQKKNKP